MKKVWPSMYNKKNREKFKLVHGQEFNCDNSGNFIFTLFICIEGHTFLQLG